VWHNSSLSLFKFEMYGYDVGMKSIKSDRLKKLETELHDLEEWLRLGLVPKKDIDKHKDEIRSLKTKLEEEKARLQFLKEGGEGEEFIIPKRSPQKGAYNEMPTIPDDGHETGSGLTEGGFESNTYLGDETTFEEETEEEYYTTAEAEEHVAAEEAAVEEEQEEDEEDESYFSDRNRWKRGGIVDPDADEW
jgi:hypothetical protein